MWWAWLLGAAVLGSAIGAGDSDGDPSKLAVPIPKPTPPRPVPASSLYLPVLVPLALFVTCLVILEKQFPLVDAWPGLAFEGGIGLLFIAAGVMWRRVDLKYHHDRVALLAADYERRGVSVSAGLASRGNCQDRTRPARP